METNKVETTGLNLAGLSGEAMTFVLWLLFFVFVYKAIRPKSVLRDQTELPFPACCL